MTVLSWFLWAGKTTILKNILQNRQKIKCAVIVNDMAELNIDANLIKQDITLSQTQEKLVEMSNGCICCTLREDLLQQVKLLCENWDYDVIIIESTGISEPIPIAQTFSYKDEELDIDLSEYVRLDTMLTVVDAINFIKDFSSSSTLIDKWLGLDENDTRPLVNLLTDQVEFCDVLIVNKIDDVSIDQQQILRKVLKWLQPKAVYIETNNGFVDIEKIINTGLFDFDVASQSAWRIQEYKRWHQNHISEVDEYGIHSFIYRRDRPFHPERLFVLAHTSLPGIIRAKGIFWIASRLDVAGNRSQAGGSIKVSNAGRRLADISEDESHQFLPETRQQREEAQTKMYGDRRQELVFIGIDYAQKEIETILDQALLTDEEMKMNRELFNDPFKSYL